MKKFLFGVMILLSPQITFSQTVVKPGMDAVKHTVTSGETVLDISKKYVVDPAEIYRANRFAIDGVTEGMVLEFYAPQKSPIIDIADKKYTADIVPNELEKVSLHGIEEPKSVQKKEPKIIKVTNRVNHKVKPGETLYGLSKLYNISVDELKNANTILMNNNLQAGQTLKIPDGTIVGTNQIENAVQPKNNVQTASISHKSGKNLKHTVVPKETLYGLSKKYNVSIDEIINQNEKLLQNGLQAGQIITIKVN